MRRGDCFLGLTLGNIGVVQDKLDGMMNLGPRLGLKYFICNISRETDQGDQVF